MYLYPFFFLCLPFLGIQDTATEFEEVHLNLFKSREVSLFLFVPSCSSYQTLPNAPLTDRLLEEYDDFGHWTNGDIHLYSLSDFMLVCALDVSMYGVFNYTVSCTCNVFELFFPLKS